MTRSAKYVIASRRDIVNFLCQAVIRLACLCESRGSLRIATGRRT